MLKIQVNCAGALFIGDDKVRNFDGDEILAFRRN